MSNISTWYTNQYSGAFRSTRLRAPSLVPSGRVTTAVAQQTLVVDGRVGGGAAAAAAASGAGAGAGKDDAAGGKRRETIFGPDVGEDDEPGWTSPDEGVRVGVDVVKGWVERAKAEEGLHATTTLQAQVNLKRPTLQLQQLDRVIIPGSASTAPLPDGMPTTSAPAGEEEIGAAPASAPSNGVHIPSPPLHIIKFAYDATSPSVLVTLTIHPSPTVGVPIEGKESLHEDAEQVKTVYRGLHAGGFNQMFTLPHSAAMDLSSAVAPLPAPSSVIGDDDKKIDANLPVERAGGARAGVSEDTNRSSVEQGMAGLHMQQSELATVPEMPGGNGGDGDAQRGNGTMGRVRNLLPFGRRRREGDVEEGNIEMAERNGEAAAAEEEAKEPERGMRVLISIEAVGPEGQPLQRRNAQLTHILVTGMWVADGGASTLSAPNVNAGKRMWVVKVVRREAVIGAHTFLLKEIYGLSTASNQSSESPTSYPPTHDTDPYASTPNECIVCLTSPRDVVLLPCRHLVVCRECAVGMVEFGAGGKVARREDAEDATGTGAAGADAGGAGTGTGTDAAAAAAPPPPVAAVAGGTTTAGRERRKKKAKGWYCPVCRQPYTSLLRLALPENAKPLRTPAASRMASRAPSVRSVRTTRTRNSLDLRRVGSRATLPDGAERMLEGLAPRGRGRDSDEEDEEEEDEVTARERRQAEEDELEMRRPQFVLDDEEREGEGEMGAGVGGSKKAEVEHEEHVRAGASGAGEGVHGEGQGRKSEDKKGWKEV